MSMLSELFKPKSVNIPTNSAASFPKEVEQLFLLEKELYKLLEESKYIARSTFAKITTRYSGIVNHFTVIRDGELLPDYCRKYKLDYNQVVIALESLENVEKKVETHNGKYIQEAKNKEKKYFDSILRDIDPHILLDENQREVVLTDEDYCLVIAGAGAGKTTTVAAKVKYLVDKQQIDPRQILVISFTNKAVDELKDKINKALSIDCPITTFHSAGNAIIRKSVDKKLNIVDSSKLYFVLSDYFKGNLLKNERMVNNLILFFGSYFDAPFEGDDLNEFFHSIAKGKYETIKSDLNEYIQELSDTRSKRQITISNEILRSRQEVEIANFLYFNNIDYQYEPIYPYNIEFSRKPYTPDFIIRQENRIAYIEHFGITESGENSRFSADELVVYKRAVKEKILLHRQHGSTLIYTFSQYNDNRPILDHLKERLEQQGFELCPRSQKEVIEKLVTSEESRYIRKLVDLVCRFISNFKTNAYVYEDFGRMSSSTDNVRTKLFLDICQGCYLEYQKYLAENNAVDFQDMINESARILREVKAMKQKLDFKYVIVDEYQDISRQRFDLTKELAAVTDAKIIAVGDDWQSIYAFSGSDITLFTKFCEIMGYGKLLKIINTYRNAQEVIDIAGNFIQKNSSQICKELISPKTINDPVIIYTYDASRKEKMAVSRSGVNYAIANAVEVALEQIIAFNRSEGKSEKSTVLLLGRYGFDGDALERSGLFEYITRGGKIRSVKFPKMDITFMTVHSSKGLGYDNVIVLNGRNETYGFPSKIEDDPILKFVIKEDRSIEYAEERRLFYVAMTRTKNRVFFIAPEQNPSEFLIEIKQNYKNVVLRGNWNEKLYQPAFRNACPICGYPLQYRYKNSYGLRLYICTNEPEICGFMTNDLTGKKLSIQKCDQCVDGYLIVKRSKTGDQQPFLGCTNFMTDKKGCNNYQTKQAYYSHYKLTDDPVETKLEPAHKHKTDDPYSKTSRTNYVQQLASSNIELTINKPVQQSLDPIFFNDRSLVDIISVILQCVAEISEKHFFGRSVLLNVLRGSSNEQIARHKLHESSSYGNFAKIKREDLEVMVEWLIANGFLLQREGQYPVLHMTYDGIHLLETITNTQLNNLARLLKERSAASRLTIKDKTTKEERAHPVFAGSRWTEEEDHELIQEIKSGLKISAIAKQHHRTSGAIKSRIEKLTEKIQP